MRSEKKMTGEVADDKTDIDNIDGIDGDVDSSKNIEDFDAGSPLAGVANANKNKASFSGEHGNDPVADSELFQRKEPLPKIVEETAQDSNHNSLAGNKSHQKPLMSALNSRECNLFENLEPISSSSSAEHRCADLAKANDNLICNNFSHIDNINTCSMDKKVEIASAARPLLQIALGNESTRANHIDNELVVQSNSAENRNTKNQSKGKEKIQYHNFSSDRKDSNESAESSNNHRRIIKGKRAMNFESSTFLGSKKFKMDNSEGSCSRSLLKKDSSFWNWMSTITNTGSRFGPLIPLGLHQSSTKSMNKSLVCVGMSSEKTAGVERPTMGFSSIFQPLYSSSAIEKNNLSDDNSQRELNDLKVEQMSNQNSSSLKQKSDERKELNGIEDLFNTDHLNFLCNGENDVLKFQDPNRCIHQVTEYPLTKYNTDTSSKTEVNCRQECSNLMHHNSITKKSTICSNDFQSRMLSYVPNSAPDMASNSEKDFVENLWISRFLRKDSPLIVNPISCRPAIELENDSQTNKSRDVGSRSQDNQVNCSNTGNDFISHLNSQNITTSKKLHQASTSPVSNNLQMSSRNVKRLDALKHIKPEKNSDELPPCATTTCTFFEEKDNKLQRSSEKNEIYASSKVAQDGFKCINGKPGNHSNQEEKLAFSNNPPHEHHQKVSEITKAQKADPDTRHFKTLDERYIGKSIISRKQFALSLRETDERDNQLTPFYYSVTNESVDEQSETFEAIRRLRLSRTEVTRLMRLPNARMMLEGFFLRLRLGKWEKGHGGAGYHVARINGAGCEKNLSVSIGCFTCIAECRFVSNHDYLEDELKAWWSTTSRSGEIPSKEELKRKINERVNFGF